MRFKAVWVLSLLQITHFQMYSGFYQHEIAANLVGAEALFEQMGYKTLPNKTLVLDGPICPDRVTNVSRDAITATVECQVRTSSVEASVLVSKQHFIADYEENLCSVDGYEAGGKLE